jgi:hypothetical protein
MISLARRSRAHPRRFSLDSDPPLCDSDPFRAVVIAVPDGGSGERAVGSEGDAVALTASAKQLLRDLRNKHGLPARTHLFPAMPAGLAMFLGQALNAVGEVVSHEMAAGDTYQEAVTLPG